MADAHTVEEPIGEGEGLTLGVTDFEVVTDRVAKGDTEDVRVTAAGVAEGEGLTVCDPEALALFVALGLPVLLRESVAVLLQCVVCHVQL